MTVNEKLVEMFGEDAPARVVGSEWARGLEVERAYLASMADTGSLQVSCGTAKVIVGFTLTERCRRRSALTVYLAFDDSDGMRWDVLRARGNAFPEIGWSRPSPRLVLQVSG